MFCEKCGNALPDNARFCAKCGNRVPEGATESTKSTMNMKKTVKRVYSQRVAHDKTKPANTFLNRVQRWIMDYLQTWQEWRKLQKREKYIWFSIHGGVIALFLCIMIIIHATGNTAVREEMISDKNYREVASTVEETSEDENSMDENEDFFTDEANDENKPVLKVEGGKCNSGNICVFGNYPLVENNDTAQPMEWFILTEEDNKLFLLSRYVLGEFRPFNDVLNQGVGATWEQCSLRVWLNDSFYKDAFSIEERNAILVTEVGDYDLRSNLSHSNDRIFCLSVKEANTYNEYLKTTGYGSDTPNYWWLRTSGEQGLDLLTKYAAYVSHEGVIKKDGNPNYQDVGVRPAMWIDLNSVSIIEL